MPEPTDALAATLAAMPARQRDALDELTRMHARRVEAQQDAARALADEDDAVRHARQAGVRWAPIAAVLGVSEVQAYRKARATGRPMP